MAMAMIKPVSVDLVDTLFTTRDVQFQMEEVVISEHSHLANKEIREVFKRETTNVIVVAIIRDGKIILNPRGKEIVLPQDTVIMLGSRYDLEVLEKNALG
jgi:voltage-gated potassium channel